MSVEMGAFKEILGSYLPLWRWGAWGWRPDEVHSLATSWTGTRSHPETHTDNKCKQLSVHLVC
jgi:hypothetical protein